MIRIARVIDARVVANDLAVTVELQVSRAAANRWLAELQESLEFVPTWKEGDE